MTVGAGFNGTTSYIESTTGVDLSGLTGAWTLGGVWYYDTDADRFGLLFETENGGTSVLELFVDNGGDPDFLIVKNTAGAQVHGFQFLSQGTYYAWFASKAAGSVSPRYHYTVDGTNWVHSNGDTAVLGNLAAAISRLSFGAERIGGATGKTLKIELATWGMWGEDTSDATCQTYSDFANLVAKANREFFTGRSLISAGTMRDFGRGNHETGRASVSVGARTVPAWFANFEGVVRQSKFAKAINGADTGAVTATLDSTTVSGGSLLVAVAGFWGGNNFAATQVTDNKSNTFAFDHEVSTGSGEACVAFYSCSNFTGGAGHTVTVTTNTVQGKCIAVVEYSRRVTFDQAASAVDDTTSPFTSGTTGTLARALGIAMATVAIDTGSNNAITADADYIQIGTSENGTVDLVCEMDYKPLAATTAEDCGWSWPGTTAGVGAQAAIAIYKDVLDGDVTNPPGAPTGLTPTAGDAQVALAWTAPASDGGSAITDYIVQYRRHA